MLAKAGGFADKPKQVEFVSKTPLNHATLNVITQERKLVRELLSLVAKAVRLAD